MQLLWIWRPLFLLRVFKRVLKPFCCWFWTFWLSRRGGNFCFSWLSINCLKVTYNVHNRRFHLSEFSQSSIQYDDISLKYLYITCSRQDSVQFLAGWWLGHKTFCLLIEVLESASNSLWNSLSYFTGTSHKPDSRTGALFEWSVSTVAAGWVGEGEAEFIWLPTQRGFCTFAYKVLHDTEWVWSSLQYSGFYVFLSYALLVQNAFNAVTKAVSGHSHFNFTFNKRIYFTLEWSNITPLLHELTSVSDSSFSYNML